jgi:hypothetical protein
MLPARLGEIGLEECRRVRLTRRFGRPRRIDEHERVWLVGEMFSGRATFSLNEQSLGESSGAAFEFPVTGLVAERNQLAIELVAAGPESGFCGDVALEIRCRAYLVNVDARLSGDELHVCGEIGGDADGVMDVYVLAEGSTIGYASAMAGKRFDIVTDRVPAESIPLRVELVNGAVVWYVAEVSR